MLDVLEIIVERLERLREDIRGGMAAKGINASGRTSESFRVVEYEGGVKLVMGGTQGRTAPLETIETGSAPQWVPLSALYEWVRDKGIPYADDRERRRIAYAVRRKIAREGTDRYINPVDVYSGLVSEAAKDINGTITATVSEYVNNFAKNGRGTSNNRR